MPRLRPDGSIGRRAIAGLFLLATVLAFAGIIRASDHWSYQPLNKPPLPAVGDRNLPNQIRNPIDPFVLAKLTEKGLRPSPEAGRSALIRRVYFDLTGLPPTADDIEFFLHDPHPHAYEHLVDRLLSSPRYGECWARHWLDIVQYADTHGYDKDKPRENAWPFRDYVIRSFNQDKPYSQFVKEQLAGDYFYPGTTDGIVALGFIAAGPFDFVGQIELREGTLDKTITRTLDRDDMVTSTMNTFLSTTAQCARCHDHKFDPITQKDYYSLQAVFAAVDRADRPYDPDPTVASRRAQLSSILTQLQTRKRDLEARAGTDPASLDDTTRNNLSSINADIDRSKSQFNSLPKPSTVFAAATDFSPAGSFTPTHGHPRKIFVLKRGSEKDPGQQTSPAALAFLPDLPSSFELPRGADESRARAALASWIVDTRNPLTWRSIVNRVWQYHFGRGLVDTPNDFGRMGSKPTHPELLDYLAAEFRDTGQSLKSLHRLILTSATYRQVCDDDPACAKIDEGNQYLWRMNRRRLDAEAIHDSLLVAAGKLDPKMYGPGYRDFAFEDDHSPRYKYHESDPASPATHRRAIYRFIVRSAPEPFMEALDCADPSQSVPRRNETLTPLQALAMLNDKLTIQMSQDFANRVQNDAGPDLNAQIVLACKTALGRAPSPTEQEVLTDVARRQGLPSACRILFNTNEFVFVD
jgi:hypothetical protein